jgi:hypothetical protein
MLITDGFRRRRRTFERRSRGRGIFRRLSPRGGKAEEAEDGQHQ